jgi:hypothetical protein
MTIPVNLDKSDTAFVLFPTIRITPPTTGKGNISVTQFIKTISSQADVAKRPGKIDQAQIAYCYSRCKNFFLSSIVSFSFISK